MFNPPLIQAACRIISVGPQDVAQGYDFNDYAEALTIIRETTDKIVHLKEIDAQEFEIEKERSILFLQDLKDQITKNRPKTKLQLLKEELQKAVDSEDFKKAAQLRDKIKELER